MSAVKMEMEMGGEEMEAVMERAWDLHDRISDAIHCLSKSHFIHSIRKKPPSPLPPSFSALGNQNHGCLKQDQNAAEHHISNGAPDSAQCADFLQEEDLFAETRSLTSIRNALEVLENQLYFLHVSRIGRFGCIFKGYFLDCTKTESLFGRYGPLKICCATATQVVPRPSHA